MRRSLMCIAGIKQHVRASLKSRLTVTLLALTALVGCAHTIAVYPLALHRASVVMDERLRGVATLVTRRAADVSVFAPIVSYQYRYDMLVEVWDSGNGGALPNRSSDPAVFIPRQPDGYRNMLLADGLWRIYTQTTGNRTILTAQHSILAERAARETAADSMIPTLLLFPILWWGVRNGVARGLAPLEAVGRHIAERDADGQLRVDETELPRELLPFVSSINALVSRLEQSVQHERKFVAEAAHELRTPLSVLLVQVSNAQRATDPHDLSERLAELDDSVRRAGALVHQLLGLARAEGTARGTAYTSIDLLQVMESIVGEYVPLVTDLGIDLGVEDRPEQALITGNVDEIRIALKNIVDNAVRYSQHGGRIDISVRVPEPGDEVVVEVTDEGAGIPEDMLERVFDRFVRIRNRDVEGSGLGLAIVRAIIVKHGGHVRLSNRPRPAHGIVARVTLPCDVYAGHSTAPQTA